MKQKKVKEIKLKRWIEIPDKHQDWEPTIWMEKPSKREVENAEEFGYTIYPCVITYFLPIKPKKIIT